MKRVFAAAFVAAVAGCAGNSRPPTMPTYAHKPRVPINKQMPAEAVPVAPKGSSNVQ